MFQVASNMNGFFISLPPTGLILLWSCPIWFSGFLSGKGMWVLYISLFLLFDRSWKMWNMTGLIWMIPLPSSSHILFIGVVKSFNQILQSLIWLNYFEYSFFLSTHSKTLQVCLKYTPLSYFSLEYEKVYDVVLKKIVNYQTRCSYPVQDMTILLTQFYSVNSFNERYDWLLPRVHEFPWKPICDQIFSPFLPLSFQKNLSQLVSHLILVFSSELK